MMPVPCPCCGAYSLTHEAETTSLLAVCDVLVLKALETMGKWILRAERRRFSLFGDRPYHEAHTVWQPEELVVNKALKGAWDVVPALLTTHGCCNITAVQVTEMLNSYVHDLVITGTTHDIHELSYRFTDRLSIPVYLHEEDCVDA